MGLPPLIPREEVRRRLQLIFPEGTPNHTEVTNLIAASTVFVALYIGATEDGEMLLQPKPVYRMTEEQAALTDDASRRVFIGIIGKRGSIVHGKRWYQDNTRESIRDDTIREGFVTLGAIGQKTDVAVTANKPRYVLNSGFAALFDPRLEGHALNAAIEAWRLSAMSPGALARIAITRQGAATGGDRVLITFPNGDARRMRPGPSASITKAVVEEFAPRFMKDPTVIAISDSGDKVFDLDLARTRAIGLNIRADQDLPDIVMVDLGPQDPLLVFVEIVATAGPINERRRQALDALVKEAGFPPGHVAYVTAYLDRGQAPFKKTISSLAWGSFAWCASEPDCLIELARGPRTLS